MCPDKRGLRLFHEILFLDIFFDGDENILTHIKWFVHSACQSVCRVSTPLVNEISI